MTVIPSQKEQSEEGINKISPSEKSRLLSLLHLGHFSTVYANIVSSFEKIIVELPQYFQHLLSQQIVLQQYFPKSYHILVSERYQPDQQFLYSLE